MGDLAALWSALEVAAIRQKAQMPSAPAYAPAGSAQAYDHSLAALPEDTRGHWERYQHINEALAGNASVLSPAVGVGTHATLTALLPLRGESPPDDMEFD